MAYTTAEQLVSDARDVLSDAMAEGGAEKIASGNMSVERRLDKIMAIIDWADAKASRGSFGNRRVLCRLRGVR